MDYPEFVILLTNLSELQRVMGLLFSRLFVGEGVKSPQFLVGISNKEVNYMVSTCTFTL